jgi:hypothetical protein
MAFRAPLLGYNTNVRHKGKLYHIQTEDSGIDHPHVITHLFADGGRIVASKKTSYADRVGSDGLPDQVKKLMQGQHKAMFISLRDGIYDEDATVADDLPELPPDSLIADATTTGQAPPSSSIELDGVRALEAASPPPPPPPPSGAAQVVATPSEELDDEQMATTPPQQGEGSLAAARAPLYQPTHEAAEANQPAALRARTDEPRTGAAKPAELALASAIVPKSSSGARSLFGGDLLSDKSLDEVILNYLAANEKDA